MEVGAVGRGLGSALLVIGLGGALRAEEAPLVPPAKESIKVAFVLSPGAVVIDYSGPWEVFQDAAAPDPAEGKSAFELYTVAATTDPIRVSGGMKVVPDFSFDNAPTPKVIVIPAQSSKDPRMIAWIKKASAHADVTMSVCTGAFVLAETGLLNGKAATTHHQAYKRLAASYPTIQVQEGSRFVEAGGVASAGGLTSGIDLALRVVERYYGRKTAEDTAFYMEYQGKGWQDPKSNAAYIPVATVASATVDPVCGMEIGEKVQYASTHAGKTIHFCSQTCKEAFDQAPGQYVK
jgi:transcriptional regulator GlxA family with amidase domain